MELAKVRESLLKRRDALFTKRVGFLAVAGLALIVGLLIRTGLYFDEPEPEQTAPAAVEAPATPPVSETAKSVPEPQAPAPEPAAAPDEKTEQTEQATADPAPAPSEKADQSGEAADRPEPAFEAVDQAEQSQPGSGVVLVAKRPVEVLASPSASAPVAYGFPAGRPFRVIGREGNFAQIQDLTSKASGWIDETALAPPPAPPQPAAAGRTSPRRSAGSTRSGQDSDVTVAPEPVETQPVERRRRGGLFGRGGLFDNIFGN